MMMMMRMVVKLRMIMFVRNLGNCLQTALPCRRARMSLGMKMTMRMVVKLRMTN